MAYKKRAKTYLIIIVDPSSCKILIILVRYFRNINFLEGFKKKHSNVKYQENPSYGIRAVPCGEEEEFKDIKRNMTKLTVAFHNFANSPENPKGDCIN